jgi:hypothetical protein
MKLLVLLICLLISGCMVDELFLPNPPLTAERFDPPDYYHQWWDEAKECVLQYTNKLIGYTEYHNIEWYKVYDEKWREEFLGQYNRHRNQIYLDYEFVNWKPLVQHEMIHAFGFDGRYHKHALFENCSYVID